MSNSKHRQELERVDDTAQQCCIVSSFISKTASCYSAWQTVSRRDLALHCFKYSGLYGFRARSRKETGLLKARKGVPLSTNTPGELKKWNTIECINLENLAHSWTTTLLRKKDRHEYDKTKQKKERKTTKRKEKKRNRKKKGANNSRCEMGEQRENLSSIRQDSHHRWTASSFVQWKKRYTPMCSSHVTTYKKPFSSAG